MGKGFRLRDYQQEAIQRVQADWRAGYKNVLGTAATGGGKTQVFLGLVDAELSARPHARVMILAHRKELVEQPLARLLEFWPERWNQAGIVMADRDDCSKQIIMASVQTLVSGDRLDRVLAHGPIDYLITDECHHSVADTYQAVYERLREANPDLLHLGVTATPKRSDGTGLVETFEKESFHYDIRYLVKRGFLVPPRWLAVSTGISLAGVDVRKGDYVGKQLASVYETQNCFELVIESHKRFMADRQAIAFVESVEGAQRLSEMFNEAGIPAMWASGETAKGDRSAILNAFRKGEYRVLVNCQLYTEGVDLPCVGGIHQVRPTKSDALYLQIVGRALRLFPGKQDALILDYAPVDCRDLVMMGDVLGVARKEAYITEGMPRGEVMGGFTFDQNETRFLEGNPAEIITRQLDYLDNSEWVWYRGPDGWMTLSLGKDREGVDRTLAITPVDDGGMVQLWLQEKQGSGPRSVKATLVKHGPFDDVQEVAEGLIGTLANPIMAAKSKQWRRQPPRPKQQRFAQQLGVWEDGLTRGEAAARITHKLTTTKLERLMMGV